MIHTIQLGIANTSDYEWNVWNRRKYVSGYSKNLENENKILQVTVQEWFNFYRKNCIKIEHKINYVYHIKRKKK